MTSVLNYKMILTHSDVFNNQIITKYEIIKKIKALNVQKSLILIKWMLNKIDNGDVDGKITIEKV